RRRLLHQVPTRRGREGGRPRALHGTIAGLRRPQYDLGPPIMRRRWYARRELEAVLLVVVAGLVAFGVNAALRLAVDTVPEASDIPPPPSPAEPLDAYAPIAARDVFNSAAPVAARTTAAWRLVGIGFQGDDARAAIEDTATHRQTLVRVG